MPVYTKVEGRRVSNRIPEVRKIGINGCNYLARVINRTEKVVVKCHITIRLDLHKKVKDAFSYLV